MAQQSRIQPLQNLNLRRRHICSLTNSQMIVLNLQQIQQMQNFIYDIVVIEEGDNKIYAYQYDQQQNSYLLMVPISFYNSTKYKCKSFIEMLCICSQTITIPVNSNYLDDFNDLLSIFGVNFRYKMGNSVYKIYLQQECYISYLDIVTFHAVQYKSKNSKQLISMKKENGYIFCLNYFKEQAMPKIYNSPQNEVEKILQSSILQIRQIYNQLVSIQRFFNIYEEFTTKSFKFNELEDEMKELILSRHIPTIADQQYQQIINEQLNILIAQQINKFYPKLKLSQANDQKYYYMIILENIFKKMKRYHLEINVDKFMFVSAKLIQMIMEVKKEQSKQINNFCEGLVRNYETKEKQIMSLKQEIQKLNHKHNLTISRLNQLSLIHEEKEKQPKSKHNTPLKDSRKYKKEYMTIQDLKQPLQIIPSNFSPQKLNKTLKNRKKSKEKLKKKDIDTKSSLKNLRKF